MSTFEFIGSGMVGILLKFFSYGKDNVATLALGSRPRQRGWKVAGQEEA
jgi:hypothetical protein